jgi:FixJ family two-component response regulator
MSRIYIIDDDASVHRALARLLRSAGFETRTFATVDAFTASGIDSGSGCVLADVRMPGCDGLELPERLRRLGCQLPVIFLSAQDTDTTRAAARRAGAAGFFRKPVDDQALIDAIEWALANGG